MEAKTIDEVIMFLEDIIQTSIKEESTLGYFAALYQKVTIAVKDKLYQNYFDDDVRMEQLDVIFANRFLLAYSNYKEGKTNTKSWEVAFNLAENNNLIVLQHLILGMNAHINLDLGIAATQVSNPLEMHNLESDFNKINELLASLVDEIKSDLSLVWRPLVWVLERVKKVDNFVINFSMGLARDGAWKFANELVLETEIINQEHVILLRDGKIAALSEQILCKGALEKFVFKIIRFTESSSISKNIYFLKKK
ncbi:hypothetical protein EV196_101249 [Mariniflexile fucanivorans]|uniref:Uncharacterized protein n=1 Tax=Mariniflexile fucanivorans TaxID=264023 RepID=A0A4R1RR84_9FLAO|nr:DUF5995 family protein [Mariniflexile fucanivorans]TCL68826.1 hypothetical protein EV196_101249 [Mariniflexile fucanivorans]